MAMSYLQWSASDAQQKALNGDNTQSPDYLIARLFPQASTRSRALVLSISTRVESPS
jgi:hypothetical protein